MQVACTNNKQPGNWTSSMAGTSKGICVGGLCVLDCQSICQSTLEDKYGRNTYQASTYFHSAF